MKRVISVLFTMILCVTVLAQIPKLGGSKKPQGAATCVGAVEMTGKNTGKVIITITPTKGWHVYGMDIKNGGPKPMVIDLSNSKGLKFKGDWKPSAAPVKTYDDMFGMDVTYWKDKVELVREFEVTDASVANVVATVSFQGCNGTTCNPPEKKNINIKVSAGK